MYVYLKLSVHMPHTHTYAFVYSSQYIYEHMLYTCIYAEHMIYLLYIFVMYKCMQRMLYRRHKHITAYHCIIYKQTYIHLQPVICYTPMYVTV